jgi:hypothetical protein
MWRGDSIDCAAGCLRLTGQLPTMWGRNPVVRRTTRKRRDMSRGSAALTIRVMLCFGGFVRRAALQHLIAASCCSRCWCSCSTLRSSFRSRSHCRSRSRSRALNFSNSSSRSLARSLSRCISRSRSKSLSSSLSRSNRLASCTHNRISLAQKTKRD